jgi:hypothetical protein
MADANQLAEALADMVAAFSWGDMNAGEASAINQARQALAAFEAQAATAAEPVAWLVLDKDGSLVHAAAYRHAAHEHINDAINEHGITEAARWVVRPAYAAPVTQAEPMTWEQVVKACEAEYGQEFSPNDAQKTSEHDKAETMRFVRMVEKHHRIKENP